jgi:hypothetical protein
MFHVFLRLLKDKLQCRDTCNLFQILIELLVHFPEVEATNLFLKFNNFKHFLSRLLCTSKIYDVE